MKKTLTTTTGVIMLATPLMLFAGSLSLDDAYLDEGPGAFSTPTAGSHDVGRTNVSTSEMYAWEVRDAYEFGPAGTTGSERTEIAVFAEGVPQSNDIGITYLKWDN